jgi:hypothetical protein
VKSKKLAQLVYWQEAQKFKPIFFQKTFVNKSQQLQISTKQSIPLDRLGNKVRVWFTLKTLYSKWK